MELWEEANKWIAKVPYTEECHQMVCCLQEEARRELEAIERALQLKNLEVPAIA